MDKYLYITDCEGPVTKNDNAYEIADFFLKDGGNIFSLLSAFDDYLGLYGGIENYRYGSTLKYILPFFLEANLTDQILRDYSRRTLVLTPGAKEALVSIKEDMDVFLISTSYEHYVEEVIKYLNLESEKVFCTRMSLDLYELKEEERVLIREYCDKIRKLPPIRWDENGHLIEGSSETVSILKGFFFDILPKFPVGEFINSVNPIGGKEKARILREVVEREGVPYKNVIYVGDSITDTEAFLLIKEKGGLSLSFNGNRYAICHAEYVVVSESAACLSEIAKAYKAFGRDGLKSLGETKGFILTDRHDPQICEISERMRRTVRGERIGALG